MAFFLTANGSFAERCEKSSDLILSNDINWNQLENFFEKKGWKFLNFFQNDKIGLKQSRNSR